MVICSRKSALASDLYRFANGVSRPHYSTLGRRRGVSRRMRRRSRATGSPSHARRALGHEPEAHLAMQCKVPQSVGECFALIEREMLQGPWVMARTTRCARLSVHAGPWLRGAGVDINRTPKIAEHF